MSALGFDWMNVGADNISPISGTAKSSSNSTFSRQALDSLNSSLSSSSTTSLSRPSYTVPQTRSTSSYSPKTSAGSSSSSRTMRLPQNSDSLWNMLNNSGNNKSGNGTEMFPNNGPKTCGGTSSSSSRFVPGFGFETLPPIEEFIGSRMANQPAKNNIIDLDTWDVHVPLKNNNLIVPNLTIVNVDTNPTNIVIRSQTAGSSSAAQNVPTDSSSSKDGEWNISDKMRNDVSGYNEYELPTRAIVYDYTTQPLGIVERKREFLSEVCSLSLPFLRPIYIDGIGLIKAYHNSCCPKPEQVSPREYPFPLIPLVRCLFYWISKGHKAKVCFPKEFSPFTSNEFDASHQELKILEKLEKYDLAEFFDSGGFSGTWYNNKMESMRACLITTVSQWCNGMRNDLDVTDFSKSHHRDKLHDRLLQPFFGHEGNLVFFSSFSAKGLCVADMILDNLVYSQADFDHFDKNQLTFTDQAKMLKLLYDVLLHDNGLSETPRSRTPRFREAHVMVEVLKRLKHFL